MTQFQQLFDLIDLKKAGRVNAAKAQWKALPAEFKTKIVEWLVTMFNSRELIGTAVTVELHSPKYGTFMLNDEIVKGMKEILPELIYG